MASCRITTWNINSVRLRLPIVKRLIEEIDPTVICLQETKAQDDQFPSDAFHEIGYRHQLIYGQKSYNGVAILSKRPFDDALKMDWCGVDDCRHVRVSIAGVDLHNFYIPAGGDIPDPDVNAKFRHKLDMLAELEGWFSAKAQASGPMILVGDFNIAPLEQDVWSHKQLLNIVSHTPIEVEALEKWRQSSGFIDASRQFVPASEKLYSWWSYRARDWQASNRGRRLDHIWLTPDLLPALKSSRIVRAARGWDKPSDHVPVTADFDI